ncbi:SDR family NAD(P)-dependent oxidoreductase [Pelosinus fermentans]|uniref:Mycocerosate synthase, 6-deoxyerythronolide-B synthase n=1 Tax=Pelosinus fermentans JBW45 TaxID=1192197 RepID=A0A0C5Q128_9FIRM|nr:SDR family NAD(P)-dependent oxidoreductase [Pelosinus fermentans]AJQ25404.1 Mycocerosate synthase, 6-deoxyerythronolide-B synthase [Pelosinus fermentans JBW45]
MQKQLEILYEQIKEQKISPENAIKEINELKLQHSLKTQVSETVLMEGDAIVAAVAPDLLQEKVVHYFKKLLSTVIGLPVHRIEADVPMEEYGIDSVMVMQLTNQLEKIFGSLPKTLFFEYQTIQALIEYFLEVYQDQLMGLLGIEEIAATATRKSAKDSAAMTGSVKPVISNRRHLRFTTPYSDTPQEKVRATDIAIIGLSGRYPQAKNIQEFWKNLQAGKDSITEIPKDRWDYNLYFDEDKSKPGKTYSKWGGFLNGVDQFDPLFFNISPREAEIIDPQERLFLQCVYETLEDAGYTREALGMHQGGGLGGDVGVFVGVMYEEYQLYGAQEQVQGRPIALAGNSASIANRVSYFCNFHGPSVTLDTMCSSSLTAIHLACQSLKQGGCEFAIAGGVNISIHPNKYLALGQGKFVSSKGRCESFGQGGDGYVPGEGVGAILLKPLSKAIAEGDHIYGIIKGTAINHGGKTNGFTVPNPNAQASVIGKAFKEAGINPRTISYIEAHGTGTSLGDPIEIAGLKKTFQEYTKDKQFCSIGSAKSNIGHCESAAGIAGVTKILLQLKYGQLVPSLHSEILNPNIDFGKTPFVVQQELAEWKRPVLEINGEIQEYPRIAGISSFGAGGSNAHVVIEEYMDKDEQPSSIRITKQNPAIIVLSAKNEQRLKEQVQQMVAAIQEQQISDENLANMAYTLQVGREAMEERVAVLVGSSKELEEKLKGFLADQDGIEDLYRGQVKRNKDTMAIFAADDEMQEILKKWIAHRKYGKLLDLWVKGMIYDWQKLYNDSKPRRISLPTYPFAKERYWVPEAGIAASSNIISPVTAGLLHPLLHQNTSDFSEQRFSSTFTGQEFFLADHVVKGQRVLPGVAYLEMARAAVEQAAGVLAEDKIGIRLKNVVWVRPVAALGQPVQVHIGLYPEENGEIAYEIYSDSETVDREPIIHSQGSAVLRSVTETPRVDLKSLQAECGQSTFTSSQCYEAFRTMGLAYGSSHQGIEVVYTGQEQVLAKLRLPASVSNTHNQFTLHPSLMDAALQATIGFMLVTGVTGSEASLKPVLPFALQELEILSNCPSVMWALLRYSAGSRAGDKVQKFDIDLCDEQGNVCVRIKGFSLRVLEREVGSVGKIGNNEMLLLEPYWKEQASILETMDSAYVQHVVMLCELSEAYRESVETCMDTIRCVTLQIEKESIEERFQAYAVQVFEEIQTILKNKQKGKVLIQVVVPTQEERQLFSGLLGLLKTAQLENPKIIGQMIEVEVEGLSQEIIEILKENSQSSIDNHVRYQGGTRWVNGWREVAVTEEISLPWKDNGVYLITGGAGGLGLIFAQEIAHTVKNATLILTGRSVLDEGKQEKIKAIETLGAFVEYRKVDVADKQAVGDLIQSIQEKFGSLSGIIHSAGVIRDKFMIQKTKEEMQEVLTPKVTGLVNLDHASKEMNLDFFLLFSSMAGSLGNVGQADYSTANAFMDGYARYRNDMVVSKQRYGQTLSINWPLWKDGGMHVDKEAEKAMQGMGMIAMETPIGIQALYQGLVACKDQVMVIEGDVARIKQKLLSVTAATAVQVEKASILAFPAAGIDTRDLLEKVQATLVQEVSKILKVKIEDIDVGTELNEYGFDSITLTQFANELNQKYKLELTPTIFFEYPTIHSFAEYLNEEYKEVFTSQFAVQPRVEILLPTMGDEVTEISSTKKRHSRYVKMVDLSIAKSVASTYEPIAIVGVSGKFPKAKDINEFWRNLVEDKDCITEIPKERWDWREYYGDPAEKANKTNIKWGGFIDGIDQFDPLFFGISPKEAEFMDPQQRLLMTYIWKAIEDAGYSAQSFSGTKTAIFVGTGSSGYDKLLSKANIAMESYSSTGLLPSVGPNRMSYFLNIHGPSEPIETACSSSLVAIHRAVSAIESGNCQMAIAGGINTIITPENHIKFNKTGMLCEDGRCKTFSNQANGYVRGEGVGMLILKKLKAAEEAGDHIYGIIRGTAVNHGGRANSLTAPNPKAQAELLQTAYTKSGIDPRTVSYIEAHGTGTELGDPIEINGLKTAFKELYKETGDPQVLNCHCGLGSVKTNIGHLELAAGIAGVIKVLLQLKNKTLVKSLHSETINPYIQLKDSPFYIVQETKEWKPLHDLQGNVIPRRAGVSSFGFGGVNGHVVIEEYIPRDRQMPINMDSASKPVIIVLSAKSEKQLKEQAQQLLDSINSQQLSDENLTDMAYTLQVGREGMEERVAVIVRSIKELEEKLRGFVEGQNGIDEFYRGQVKRNKDTMAVFTADEDMAKTVEAWISKKKYAKIMELWVKGLIIDWNKLYGDSKPCRISLPAYPFTRERYWVPETSTMDKLTSSAGVNLIHPLLHQNTSDLSEQRFSSTFTGQEFFLADHIVKGQRVLPGVVYLEMARAAVEQAAGALKDDRTVIQLKNVVWARPLAVGDQSLQIHIGLYLEASGEIAYEIYSQSEQADTKPVVHSQGSALLSSATGNLTLNLKALQDECNQSTLTSSQCYEIFGAMGIEYGSGHQGIEVVYVASNQVLAKLSLPSSISDTQAQFVLHPSLMDSVLQVSMAFMMVSGDAGGKASLKPVFPYALQELQIVSNCPSLMWALLRYSVDSRADDKVRKLDIDLCDEQGNVCIQMKGFSLRELGGELGLVGATASINRKGGR